MIFEASINSSDNEFHKNALAMRTVLYCVTSICDYHESWCNLFVILVSCEWNVKFTANIKQKFSGIILFNTSIHEAKLVIAYVICGIIYKVLAIVKNGI